jgi:hypothetical protein
MLHVHRTCVQGMRYTLRPHIPPFGTGRTAYRRIYAQPREPSSAMRACPLAHPRVCMQGQRARGAGERGGPRSRSTHIYAREIPRRRSLGPHLSPPTATLSVLSSAKSRLDRRSSPAKIRLGQRVRRLLQPEILVDATR